MGKIVIIASGKGGTGKTTITSHIGAMLADMGHLTAVIDADAGFRNLDIALGMESSIVYDYSDYINGSADLDAVLVKSSELENLYFVPAPQSVPTTDFDEEKTTELWNSLKNRFEFVLADAPAGMGDGFMFAAKYADESIIVAAPETSSLRDADRVITELEDQGVETIRLILNRVKPELIEQKVLMNVDDCMDVLSIPILGIVPEDAAVTRSMAEGKPLIEPDGYGAGTAFKNIAERLLGNYVQMMNFDINKKKSLRERIADLFKRA
ncbi:MAG: septum site-determining protein MinD [Candidatus Ornithomonoglobus sp.]